MWHAITGSSWLSFGLHPVISFAVTLFPDQSSLRLTGMGCVIGLGLLFQTGCENPVQQFRKDQNQRPASFEGGQNNPFLGSHADSSNVFSRQQFSAAVVAFQHWEQHSRDPAFAYKIDSYDSRLSPRFRQQLQAELPPVDESSAELQRVFTFEKVVFPEGDWAYVTYREGNRYHSIEYTDVLRGVGDDWVVKDHFIVAEGLMDPVMVDFRWSLYRENQMEAAVEPPAGD